MSTSINFDRAAAAAIHPGGPDGSRPSRAENDALYAAAKADLEALVPGFYEAAQMEYAQGDNDRAIPDAIAKLTDYRQTIQLAVLARHVNDRMFSLEIYGPLIGNSQQVFDSAVQRIANTILALPVSEHEKAVAPLPVEIQRAVYPYLDQARAQADYRAKFGSDAGNAAAGPGSALKRP